MRAGEEREREQERERQSEQERVTERESRREIKTGLAGALGRRGRGALKKSDPGGGAGRSKKVGGADFSQKCASFGLESRFRDDHAVAVSTELPDL